MEGLHDTNDGSLLFIAELFLKVAEVERVPVCIVFEKFARKARTWANGADLLRSRVGQGLQRMTEFARYARKLCVHLEFCPLKQLGAVQWRVFQTRGLGILAGMSA